MSITLKQIAVKLLSGELPPMSSEEISRARLAVCEQCPEFQRIARMCKLCGCFLDLKTKLLQASCPADKW